MVKGDAHVILQASLARLQKEGLTEIILGKVQNSLSFDIYREKNEEEARQMYTSIKQHKSRFYAKERKKELREMKEPKKRKIIVIDVDDSEEEMLPPKRRKCMELERINEACKVCIEELLELDEVIAQIGK